MPVSLLLVSKEMSMGARLVWLVSPLRNIDSLQLPVPCLHLATRRNRGDVHLRNTARNIHCS
jgi:hypothetical protein